jgi:hypothetical protein
MKNSPNFQDGDTIKLSIAFYLLSSIDAVLDLVDTTSGVIQIFFSRPHSQLILMIIFAEVR